MESILADTSASLIKTQHFSHIPSLWEYSDKVSLKDWFHFKKSWNNLHLDNYMADGGKYRFRRYSVLTWKNTDKKISLEKHQPHYQSIEYNYLHGGIERHFEPFEQHILESLYFSQLLTFSINVFNQVDPASAWHIEAHQFRITIDHEMESCPTPEGVHRDGRHYILMMLIDKVNVSGGITTLYDNQRNPLSVFNMHYPGETLLLNDTKTLHGVSSIQKIDKNHEAYRDMLVITFNKEIL